MIQKLQWSGDPHEEFTRIKSGLKVEYVCTYDYATRSTSLQHLNPSPFRTNIRKFFPTVIGCCYWNDIPISMQEKPIKELFKRALFSHSLSQYWLMSSSDHVLFTYCLRCDSYSLSCICILYLISYCTASFYCMKNVMIFKVKGI